MNFDEILSIILLNLDHFMEFLIKFWWISIILCNFECNFDEFWWNFVDYFTEFGSFHGIFNKILMNFCRFDFMQFLMDEFWLFFDYFDGISPFLWIFNDVLMIFDVVARSGLVKTERLSRATLWLTDDYESWKPVNEIHDSFLSSIGTVKKKRRQSFF